ncbi:NifU family protein [Mycoplasmopsis californica]|uniref:NifU family protein n=2 Tax=Mycoplasmopsis californica TaxID=2113 RepID=A0A059XMF3_9BACT|nr:NifU family protein [Mycoplasmopsis californica]
MEVISLSYNQNQKRELIMAHYTKPIYKKEINGDKIIKHGQACADYLEFNFEINDGKIQNLIFDGRGCAFMMASTDLLIKQVDNKNIEFVLDFIDKYDDFVKNKNSKVSENHLREMAIFKNVNEHPNRYFCATMLSSALKEKINEQR